MPYDRYNGPQRPQPIQLNLPNFNPKLLFLVPLGIILLVAVTTMAYTVQEEEEGVVLRFGKYIKTVQPGLKFKMPFGIDKVERVPVKRQLKAELGIGNPGNTNPYQHSVGEDDQERQMVSGDLNAALVEWVIQYRITRPQDYLFEIRRPEETLRDASESVMREVVGNRTVDEVITTGRQDIERECLEKLQKLVGDYMMGMEIDQVQLKNVNPPKEVQASFNEVNQAEQEKEQSINVANGEYNKQVPKARGDADRMEQEAEGYSMQRINEAQGDAAKFDSLYAEYVKAPEVTRRRIYLETIHEVLPKLGQKIILDEQASQVLPFLNLGNGGGGENPIKRATQGGAR